MSETGPVQAVPVQAAAVGWRVHPAQADDVEAIAVAIASLLVELGGTPAPTDQLQEATRALLEDPSAGAVLVAKADGALVGVLAASWQLAIHIPGRYGLIQDLWVERTWRSKAIGAALLRALFERAHEFEIPRIEVGLPKESFSALAATETFYRANGFSPLGPRLRVQL